MQSFFKSWLREICGAAGAAACLSLCAASFLLPLNSQAASQAQPASSQAQPASSQAQTAKVKVQGGGVKPARQTARRIIIPAKPSVGMQAGLHLVHDSLSLRSSVAYVIDQDTQEVLFSKNEEA